MSTEEKFALVPVGQDLVEMADPHGGDGEQWWIQLARGLGGVARMLVEGVNWVTGDESSGSGAGGCSACAARMDETTEEEFRELLADLGDQISLHRDNEQVLYEDSKLWEVLDRLRTLGPQDKKTESR